MLNHKKHGVPFEEAAAVFADQRALDWRDPEHSIGELRFKRLGISHAFRVLLVAYTIRRTGNGIEEVRIISARPASRKERKAYAG